MKAVISRQHCIFVYDAVVERSGMLADAADDVVVVVRASQFISCRSIAKVSVVYNPKLLECHHGPVYRRWIHGYTVAFSRSLLQNFDREGALLVG